MSLNGLIGPSAGPLARIPYSILFRASGDYDDHTCSSPVGSPSASPCSLPASEGCHGCSHSSPAYQSRSRSSSLDGCHAVALLSAHHTLAQVGAVLLLTLGLLLDSRLLVFSHLSDGHARSSGSIDFGKRTVQPWFSNS